jgi:hypothetical protein
VADFGFRRQPQPLWLRPVNRRDKPLIQNARRLIAKTIGKPWDTYALQLLNLERADALPWTSSAPRPGLVCCLINDIRINRRRTIVEFGSGVSSLVIAGALDPRTQRLISFEHDQDWANYVAEQLDRLDLADRCQVVHAPLRPCELSVDTSPWYDIDVIRNSLESLEVDVVICDGPPAHSHDTQMARYPAMPALQSMLANSYSVYLDDIDRSSERKIARLWSDLLQISFSYQLLRGSFAVGVKGAHYNSLI